MISFLVFLLILAVVLYVVHFVVGMLDLPPQVKTLALLVVGVIGLMLIVQRLGWLGGLNL